MIPELPDIERAARQRLREALAADGELAARWDELTDKLANLLRRAIQRLDTEGGRFVRGVRARTAARRIIRQAFLQFEAYATDGYSVVIEGKRVRRAGLPALLRKWVTKILRGNRSYTKLVKPAYDGAALQSSAINAHLRALGLNGDTVVRGEWLDSLRRVDTIKAAALRNIGAAVRRGRPIKEVMDYLRVQFRRAGTKDAHFRTHAQNLFMGIDREASVQFAAAADLSYFIFTGTAVKAARSWCGSKIGRIYSSDIYATWNAQDWPGKIPWGDVRTTLGGYNCRHHAAPISAELARLLVKRGRKHGLTAVQLRTLMAA